ncbi:MAG TPA: alpha/beta hydrolase [Phycisphaerae bacterium]|nr:alpha/beta hydrolase [Phycisphaerae bacterium]
MKAIGKHKAVGVCALVVATGLFAAGCDARRAVLNTDDLDRGLILLLPGIDGRGLGNDIAAHTLCDEHVGMAVEIYDWTRPFSLLGNQTDVEENHRAAAQLARRIAAYHREHPGRPVWLIGHSGGTAIAVWAAEALPAGEQVEGIVLLASSLSPTYGLGTAMGRTRQGIVSFHSDRDSALLGVGTSLFGTMDGRRCESAGKVGFHGPGGGRLRQVAWRPEMARAGNDGGHFGCLAGGFVSRYVAPLLRSGGWDAQLPTTVRQGTAAVRTTAMADVAME